ncbi:MAG TPA: glycosyltransferase [Bryobacteraceae bacterium]|jgi:glycosyltransferase involved in cell wall biosynthesis|nr:glycosyltransferase [Bryobacteraceae bacterium]
MSALPLPGITRVKIAVNAGPAWDEQWRPGSDLLLVAENAEIAPESIAEMQDVLHLHERHGAVSPRSSSSGLLSLPPDKSNLSKETAFEIWQRVGGMLARYQVVPSVAPECTLIKSRALEWIGGFDQSFDSFTGALEDFVCRMNRRGFSAVVANRAFVSSGARPGSSERDGDTLLYRYPEYEYKFARFDDFERDPLERFAALYTAHRPRILYDLFHLSDKHSGTSEFGLSLLAALAHQLESFADLVVGAHLSNRFFLPELAGYRIYDETGGQAEVFDLAFKPCQLLSWADFRRLDSLAPRMAFTLQDIIGIRCDYLNAPERQFVVEQAVEMADCVFSISNFSSSDFAARFGQQPAFRTIYHGTNYGYRQEESLAGEHVLVVGNEFAHKGLADVLRYVPDELPLVVLGSVVGDVPVSVRSIPSGSASRQHLRDLFSRASVVIYPSYYEGFGLPVIDALALGKPVVVLDTEINRELQNLLSDPNLHRVANFEELPVLLNQLMSTPVRRPMQVRRWSDAAAEYATVFRELLGRKIDPEKVRSRRALLRLIASGS